MKIVIIDYGMGNIHSVKKALELYGAKIKDQIASLTGVPVKEMQKPSSGGGADGDDSGSVESSFARGDRSLEAFRRHVEMYPMKSALRTPAPSLLDREFGGDFKYTKTGKPIPASAWETKLANDKIVKAAKSLSDPHRYAEVRKQMQARGGIPRVGW